MARVVQKNETDEEMPALVESYISKKVIHGNWVRLIQKITCHSDNQSWKIDEVNG